MTCYYATMLQTLQCYKRYNATNATIDCSAVKVLIHNSFNGLCYNATIKMIKNIKSSIRAIEGIQEGLNHSHENVTRAGLLACAHAKESEKTLETRLVSEIKSRGGVALKFTSQFHRGIPDRIVLLPHRTIAFVEMKSTGERPGPLQIRAMRMLVSLGFRCFVIDSTDSLEEFLSKMDSRLARINQELSDEI